LVDVLLVYAGLQRKTTVKFKDGKNILLTKSDHMQFYGQLYRRYLEDHGKPAPLLDILKREGFKTTLDRKEIIIRATKIRKHWQKENQSYVT
jgi:hypothetical protein